MYVIMDGQYTLINGMNEVKAWRTEESAEAYLAKMKEDEPDNTAFQRSVVRAVRFVEEQN